MRRSFSDGVKVVLGQDDLEMAERVEKYSILFNMLVDVYIFPWINKVSIYLSIHPSIQFAYIILDDANTGTGNRKCNLNSSFTSKVGSYQMHLLADQDLWLSMLVCRRILTLCTGNAECCLSSEPFVL